jgi:hypothetical protein
MSLGGPFDNSYSKDRLDRWTAEAEASRAAHAAGSPASAGRLGSVFQRWRERRRLWRTDLLESKITARENLRDFKRSTGDEPGQWTGGHVAAAKRPRVSE